MKKLVGMILFLLVLYVVLLYSDPGARTATNHANLAKRIGFYGILGLGAGLLIITGGIDLSIGSVVGLCATLMAIFLVDLRYPPLLCIVLVLLAGTAIGLVNGLLVTRLRVQAFVVTLCGLFIYRGAARWIARDQVKGLGTGFETLKEVLYKNQAVFGLPMFLVIFLVLAALATVFLHFSVYGRYFYAIGANERAARYSGIATDRYKVMAYVICSTLAAFAGILFLMEQNSSQPSDTGSFFELYAIAGAVLGGCSLRGGEGTVLGILVGTTILWILPNLANMWGVRQEWIPMVFGGALLLGAILDEWMRAPGGAGQRPRFLSGWLRRGKGQ